jgi:hypothetical protein
VEGKRDGATRCATNAKGIRDLGFLPVVRLACGSVGEETRQPDEVRNEREVNSGFGIPAGGEARLRLGWRGNATTRRKATHTDVALAGL